MTGRTILLATTAVFGLLGGAHHGASAQTTNIIGGGSTLASPTYNKLFKEFEGVNKTDDFSDNYTPSGSGAAQTAVITDTPNVTGGATPFEFGASDATITASQLSQWNTGGTNSNSVAYGKPVNGLLVEIPTIGTPITVPVNLTGVSNNTTANLADADLCGIFSGKITSWTSISSASSVPSGNTTIKVAYRLDGSGTSFLFTQHLAAVCTSSNSNITFSATTNFAGLFPGGTVPSNFVGGTGSPGVQGAVDNNAGAVGYLSPDYTQEVSSPNKSGGAAPYVAEVKGVEPTVTNTQTALAQATPIPTSGGAAYNTADPNSFIPVVAAPTSGYPIVGYTTWLLSQCFADANVASGLVAFINDLYGDSTFASDIEANGFVPVPNTSNGATAQDNVINDYLTSTSSTAIAGAGQTGCTASGITGR